MAISNLTKKFLVQELTKGDSQTEYSKYNSETLAPAKYIEAGEGLEKTYSNQVNVVDFKPDQYTPDSTDFANNNMSRYVFSDYILLPDSNSANAGIVEVNLDEHMWLDVEYFLSGKLAEQYSIIKEKMYPSIEKYLFTLNIANQQNIYSKLGASTATSWTQIGDISILPAHSYITDTYATNQLDALKDLQVLIKHMSMDNKTFAWGNVSGDSAHPMPSDKYINTRSEDLVMICSQNLKYTLLTNLNKWSVRDKQSFEKIVESFIAYPTQYIDPKTNTTVQLNGANFVKDNQILIIEKSQVERIFNFQSEFSQFFAKNATTFFTSKIRTAISPFCFTTVALYECDGLLTPVSVNP